MTYSSPCDPDRSNNNQYSLPIISLITFIAATFAYTAFCLHGGLLCDEFAHAPQIWAFYSNSSYFDEKITVLPTYHYVMGFAIRQIGYYSDNTLKLINLLISLLSIPIFYTLIKKYYAREAGIRTLQLFFLPSIFIYYFLIYTDIWTLLLIALNLYLALDRRYITSALVGVLAISLRQDSVMWIGLSFLLICFEPDFRGSPLNLQNIIRNAVLKGHIYLIIFAAFLLFTIYNGGVAIGDKERHNSGLINISNFYIFLIVGWFLFLPLNIKLLPDIFNHLKRPWVLVAVLAGFFLYMSTLANPHEYNNSRMDYYVHNGMANLLATNMLVKGLSYPIALWMMLSLILMKLPEVRFKWILLVIPLAVIFHPMIEPRYYIPAYLLIQLVRPALSETKEAGTTIYYILLSAYVLYGAISGKFFL